jgi:hypothetical protein
MKNTYGEINLFEYKTKMFNLGKMNLFECN